MTCKVLIVDDEPSIRELLNAFLDIEGGYDCITAASGEEGLKKLYEHRPDLVITDIMMPGMDGYEFAHLIRSTCDTPIMVITGVTGLDDETEVRRITSEVDDYMTKPIMMDEFLGRVAALLREKADVNRIKESV